MHSHFISTILCKNANIALGKQPREIRIVKVDVITLGWEKIKAIADTYDAD